MCMTCFCCGRREAAEDEQESVQIDKCQSTQLQQPRRTDSAADAEYEQRLQDEARSIISLVMDKALLHMPKVARES